MQGDTNSILISIKSMLGLPEDLLDFDTDIIININSVFMILNQIGVGPEEPFSITSESDQWSSFLEDRTDWAAVKTYLYLKVRLLFDPPSTSFKLTAMENQTKEMEWRLEIQNTGKEVIDE